MLLDPTQTPDNIENFEDKYFKLLEIVETIKIVF